MPREQIASGDSPPPTEAGETEKGIPPIPEGYYPPCYAYAWYSPETVHSPSGWFDRVGFPRLLRRWYWFLLALVIGAIGGAVLAKNTPATYEARAQIVPLQGREVLGINPQIFGIDIIQDILRANLPTSFDTLSGIKIRSYLESYWLSRLIMEEHNLAHSLLNLPAETPLTLQDRERAVLRLQSQLQFEVPRFSDILTIRFLSNDPEHGAVMIQAYLDRLDRFLREQTIERSQSNADYLQGVRDTLRDRELIQRLNSLIMTQYEQIAYARASGNAFFEVLEPPHPRYKAVAPNPRAYTAGGALVGVLLIFLPLLLIPSRKEKS